MAMLFEMDSVAQPRTASCGWPHVERMRGFGSSFVPHFFAQLPPNVRKSFQNPPRHAKRHGKTLNAKKAHGYGIPEAMLKKGA